MDKDKKRAKFSDQNFKKIIVILISLSVVILVLLFLYLFCFRSKKDVYFELGSKEITLNDFFHNGKYCQFDSLLTDLSTIDFTKVGEYDVEIKDLGLTKKIKLHIVDTTAPEVVFKDVYAYTNYEIKAEDFIVSKSDLSNMNVRVNEVTIDGFGDYPVEVVVEDEFQNVTKKECILHIGVIKTEYILELGTPLKKEDILYDMKDKNSLRDEEISNVNRNGVGEYTIKAIIDGKEFTSKIVVQDTLPPVLLLKQVKIYDDVESLTKEDFIASVTDFSGEVSTSLKSNITYKNLGEQEVIIEAIDKYGNKIEEKTTLNIIKDTQAPTFSGVTSLTVSKNSFVDFKKGINAWDTKDGNITFDVDTSKVNLSKYGTYFAVYTAIDKAGNKKSVNRRIEVLHDEVDLQNKIQEYANKIGNSVPEINDFVKHSIRYSDSWGENDPVWYGLQNFNGNCYVHAMVMDSMLKAKGYETMLIWTTDKTHYWNLVKVKGSWKHTDATPGDKQEGIILATDEERYEKLQYKSHPRDWDHSKWPEAK